MQFGVYAKNTYNGAMTPQRLTTFIDKNAKLEQHSAGRVFHARDFSETLFMLKTGYVKRYQVTKFEDRVIELIYGPSHIFPLSQLYKKIFSVDMNQEDLVYVYQTMTDIEISRISVAAVVRELKNDPILYKDLFFEAGLRLKSNIVRLASNALKDDYQKIAHQLVCLANEFGNTMGYHGMLVTKIEVPLTYVDMAEQLNISSEVADAVISNLCKNNLLLYEGGFIMVPDLALLKDIYLA
jgi:CRP-like cAMP-binding protein